MEAVDLAAAVAVVTERADLRRIAVKGTFKDCILSGIGQ